MDYSPPDSSVHGDSPGTNIGVGCHALLQGIFPTQGLNPGLPRCRSVVLYSLSHQGSPRILEWVAYPFSRGSSQPRSWTGVSCIAGGFFTSWAVLLRAALIEQLWWSSIKLFFWCRSEKLLKNKNDQATSSEADALCLGWGWVSVAFLFLKFILNWRVIASQCCVDICQTTT